MTRSSKVITPDPRRPMPEIDPAEARRRIDAGEAVLVDVRESASPRVRESARWDAGRAPDVLHLT
jgi:rhodanese-related sulfurtransferase